MVPFMSSPQLHRAQDLVARRFERGLVAALVLSLLVIHLVVDYKIAFLAFYSLPVILAAFRTGRRGGVMTAALASAMVAFMQAVAWAPDADLESWLALVPWAGFLVLTGYVVGLLAEHRQAHETELRSAYMAMLELLTVHLEASEQRSQGHSYRVSARAMDIARQMGLGESETDQLRIAALLHELRPGDPRLTAVFRQFPAGYREIPVAGSMRSALHIVDEYDRYFDLVGGHWPVDHLRVRTATKILAVADTFETLQLPAGDRPPMSVWNAMEEVERGAGTTFAADVVEALRAVVTPPRSGELSASTV
jgi:HD-GYP domain-containing protein (c-di-GMP phosphodiesterase class II)